MTAKTNYGSKDDFSEYIEETFFSDEYRKAKACAILSGWKPKVYKELFQKFIISTQENVNTNNSSAVKTKGDPLEDIARYFLEKGGFVRTISSIKESGVWELDGHGLLHRENLEEVFGKRDSYYAGSCLIVECKNYKTAISGDEFSKYQSRVTKFGCQVGVFVSTSGFSIGNGSGIAQEIHLDFRGDVFHLLLTIEDFCIVYDKKIPPMHLLLESLHNARFNKYRVDKKLQNRMSKGHCREIAKEYFNLLTCSGSDSPML